MGRTRLHFTHYCILNQCKMSAPLLGHWRLHFSSMEESEGVSFIYFYSLWCVSLSGWTPSARYVDCFLSWLPKTTPYLHFICIFHFIVQLMSFSHLVVNTFKMVGCMSRHFHFVTYSFVVGGAVVNCEMTCFVPSWSLDSFNFSDTWVKVVPSS